MGFQHKTYTPCGARCKRTGEACRNPAMNNGRCRLHGGKTPTGVKAHQFSHGYYSEDPIAKRLWQAIQRNYREMLKDERAARWLENNPMPNPSDYKSARAYMKAGQAWQAAYLSSSWISFKSDKIEASEAQAAYNEYCEIVDSREFWDVYLLAVYGVKLLRRDN
jgi:hypothetical protein